MGSKSQDFSLSVLPRPPQYFNDEVRAFSQGQLSQAEAPQLPASPRDLQVQVEQLIQMVEGIAVRLVNPHEKGFGSASLASRSYCSSRGINLL